MNHSSGFGPTPKKIKLKFSALEHICLVGLVMVEFDSLPDTNIILQQITFHWGSFHS